MDLTHVGPLRLHYEVERWPLVKPFCITGHTFLIMELLVVYLEKDGCVGRGEAAGVYYKNDTPEAMIHQIRHVEGTIAAGINHDLLLQILPAGGARNALDCALWDLEAQMTEQPVWRLVGLDTPRALLTTFSCSADMPDVMAHVARSYSQARAIKLKLTGDPIDSDRVSAVRDSLPQVWLGIDANQGFTRTFLERLMPVLVEKRVSLIEQPFPVGQEGLLDGFDSPIPIAADESVQVGNDIQQLVGRFDVVNIKLDKCGGVAEAMRMVRRARECGLRVMVGNMLGTSLAMAPAFLVGQLCDVVDLDGPIFLKNDRAFPVCYTDGFITCPDVVWGHARSVHTH